MNYIKLLVLLLALPTCAGAAEHQVTSERIDEQSCGCSCSCFGSITTSFKNYRERREVVRQQEEALKKRKANITHMLEDNPARLTIMTHTTSTDLTNARLALGLPTNTDSAKHEQEVAREVRGVAYEIQANKAGVPVDDWKNLDDSALARSRRPVIHRATVLEGHNMPPTLVERIAAQKAAAQEADETDGALHARARVGSDVYSRTLLLIKLPPRLRESDEKQPEPLTLPGQVNQTLEA